LSDAINETRVEERKKRIPGKPLGVRITWFAALASLFASREAGTRKKEQRMYSNEASAQGKVCLCKAHCLHRGQSGQKRSRKKNGTRSLFETRKIANEL